MRAYMLTLPLVALALPIGSATAQQTWSGTVGLGVGSVQKYVGGDEYRSQAIPYIQVAYGQRFVAGVLPSGNGIGLGAYLARRGPLTWMLDASQSFEREEKDGDAHDVDGRLR